MALMACALWLAGVELMPALHQALHHRLGAHRHDGDSIVALSTETKFSTIFETASHRHADGSLHTHPAGSDDPHRHRRTKRIGDEVCIDPPSEAGHASGLAHHAAALAPAAPPVTQPLPVDRRPTLVADAIARTLIDRAPPAALARGPPLAA